MKLNKILFGTHITLIFFILFHFLFIWSFNFGVNSQLVYFTRIVIYLTGVLLFFLNVRRFRFSVVYYSLYLCYPLVVAVAWLIDGMMGLIVGAALIFYFVPTETVIEKGQYQIREDFNGVLDACCDYSVYEVGSLLETKVGEFQLEMKSIKGVDLIDKNQMIVYYGDQNLDSLKIRID
ncbi:hypothetical protein V6R21_17420 [Limibacter armeniacum]|uniref:hypothetical protein n=1 Tax=Limibacter armeniacum TaxID=466084 RepID=UPI002FE6A551